MKQLILLTKNNLVQSFFTNKGKNKKNNKKSFSFTGIIIFFSIFSFLYNFLIASSFSLQNEMESYLVLVMVLSIALSFIFTLLKFESSIFMSKDYEMLESFPIRKSTIIASKILGLYLFDLCETLIIILPAIIFNIIFKGSVLSSIILLFLSFVLPLIPIALSGLISFLFTLLTAKIKIRGFILAILYILFLLMIFFVSFFTSSDNVDFFLNILNSKFFSVIYLILNGNIIAILSYILISILMMSLIVLFISLLYKKINVWLIEAVTHKEYKKDKEGSLTSNKALFKKDFRMLLRKPMLLINMLIGPIMGFIFIIFFKFLGTDSETSSFLSIFSGYMANYFFMITQGSYALISFEGKSFELIKSYPIDKNAFIKSKIKVSLFIPLLISILSAILYLSLNYKNVLDVLFVALSLIMNTITTVILGTLCGLKWPKFDFVNENEILKNSKPAIVSVLVSILVGLVGLMLGIFLSLLVNPFIAGIISFSYYLVYFITVLSLYQVHSKALILKL